MRRCCILKHHFVWFSCRCNLFTGRIAELVLSSDSVRGERASLCNSNGDLYSNILARILVYRCLSRILLNFRSYRRFISLSLWTYF